MVSYQYQYKVVKSGAITEVYAYENPMSKRLRYYDEDDESEKVVKNKIIRNDEKENNSKHYRRDNNIKASKKKLNRLIHANIGQYDETDKFITLTFETKDKQSPTREEVIYWFKKFIKRMKYHGKDFEYIYVIERGSRGTRRLHIHMLAFNFPYMKIERLQEYWKYGRVDIQATQTIEINSYLVKYVEKQLEDGTIGKGEKFYFCSKGIKRPTTHLLTEEQMYEEQHELLRDGTLWYQYNFTSEYVGNVMYYKYVNFDKLGEYSSRHYW